MSTLSQCVIRTSLAIHRNTEVCKDGCRASCRRQKGTISCWGRRRASGRQWMSQIKSPHASSRLLALTRSIIHISPDNIQQADSTGTWLADVYDAIDYVEALDRAGKVTVDFDESADDFIYGEFDMGFFLGLLARLNPTDDAIFADIGSGRGQLVILAALTRKWRRCVGIEIVPILHEMACAALALVEKDKGDQISQCVFEKADFLQNPQLLAEADVVFAYATKMPVDGDQKLLMSRPLRSVLPLGARVVTVNRQLEEEAGYSLEEELEGPNPETGGKSVAYVYLVI